MAGAVERIEQDIAALEQLVRAIAQEFHDTYHQYLTDLGQSVRQQLILAGYHICTKGYPDRFLQLPFSQRQQFQQSLRKLAQQAQVHLLEQIEAAYTEVSSTDENELDESELDELIDTPDDSQSLEVQSLESPLESQSSDQLFEFSQEPQTSKPQQERQSVQSPDQSIEQPTEPTATVDSLDTPEAVAYWQERIEEGIEEMLQTLSHAANRLLQQASILSDKLPEPVLEVAAKAGLSAETVSGTPNLLNLLVETEDDDEEESAVTHIVAIHLRLSEVEFGDATLSTWRSKIRSLSARLNQLGRQYHKKQRERAIAEAEAAWRASWFEE